MARLLNEVKNASYYDSVKLFKAGETALREANETSNIGALAEMHLYYGNYFFYIRKLDKAKGYYEQSLKESTDSKDSHFEILAQARLAYLEYQKGNHIQSERVFYELLERSKKLNDHDNVAELLNLHGIISEEKNDLQAAAKFYLEGLTFSESHNLKYYPAVFRNNLGIIKLNTGQIKEAMADFTDGLVIAERENNKRLASHIQINMCLGYVMDNKPEEANRLFPKVLEYSKENNLPEELASNYVTIGSTFTNTGKDEIAIAYYDSAISVLQKNNLSGPLAETLIGKADVLIKMKKTDEVNALLKKIEALAMHTNDLAAISRCHFIAYQIELSKENYKNALANYVKYSTLKDSAATKMNNKIIEELQFNYRVQQKETELEKERSRSILLEKSNQQEKFMKRASIAIAVIILVLIAILFYLGYSRNIRKKQAQFSRQLIQNIEEERQRIAMDLHDDIGQSLSIIKSKLINGKQHDQAGAPNELEGDIGKVIEKTREISKSLFPSSLAKIGLTRLTAMLMENIQSTTGLECSFEITENVHHLPLTIQTHIFRIIQECTNNTIKHSGATGLKISITEDSNEFILMYQDNGKGIKIKTNNHGIGLEAIHERAKIINGSVDIDEKAEKGFKLILRFKSVKTEQHEVINSR
ncbi:MAG: hypothetical protein HYU69_15795 [Bacteroidetes bacterium]|nr:hypothetical protein [Bacteroidota bacterium]